MKTALQLRLAQHLTLTPQLQQSIRLLQLSTLELREEIERAVRENPLLELESAEEDAGGDAVEWGTSAAVARMDGLEADAPLDGDEYDWDGETLAPAPELREAFLAVVPGAPTERVEPLDGVAFEEAEEGEHPVPLADWSGVSGAQDGREELPEREPARRVTLAEHLLMQVPLLRLPAALEGLVKALIYCLDEDGFLDATPEELTRALGLTEPIDPSTWEAAVAALQRLEPAGVGARSIAECLRLQLAQHPPTPARRHAESILRDAFEPMSRGEWARVRKICLLDDEELERARQLLRQLTPRPGAAFADVSMHALTPDVIVRRAKEGWIAELNPAAVPRLKINSTYVELLQRHKNGRSVPLSSQLQEARWLVKNVAQRFETILRVSSEIVRRQQAFFEHGEVAMRPLVLRDIAEALGLHESTVSRVTSQKYLTCPRGTYELKFFFGSHVATDMGGAASSTAIRAMIRELVAQEDPAHPLTDQRIAELLGQQGIVVARRTVAKYREQLNIAPVSERRAKRATDAPT
ncbi:MAG: RNA polymerase factor sigma-54 [Casimicrobiaceae bacterium]|nr:RNA polymerase factor sigma-54 [Casimicrobiaceae bacterium]MDW8311182.1 RNA polymerase factor sigma-54 [Burkholderiales bacterium]